MQLDVNTNEQNRSNRSVFELMDISQADMSDMSDLTAESDGCGEINAIPIWAQADGMAEMKQVVTEMSKLDTEVRHGVAFFSQRKLVGSTHRYG